jgi:clan AA aspartic protease
MITGRVNEKLEAVLTLSIYDSQGNLREIEALIDTGYTAHLTLPTAIITELGLENFATGQLTMADGSQVVSELYYATMIWDGQSRKIEVDALESEVLVGMSLLEGFDLYLRIAVDGVATITSFR